ncbi:hypothetical protein ACFU99_05825 [Streptomyces sp. NPDC057654]|uniref:hypothetical protein n=1 Tax=Streptomyces sp. NPDC057654 TaxID=3346196 RepID=UPI00367FF058
MNAITHPWTIATQTRREVSPNHMQGVFLATNGSDWIVGRQFDGPTGSTGFSEIGEWWHSRWFTLDNPTENMVAALDAYPDTAMKASVWHRLFAQDAAQSLCRFLAGPARPGLAWPGLACPSYPQAGARSTPATGGPGTATRPCCRSTRPSTNSSGSCFPPVSVRRTT